MLNVADRISYTAYIKYDTMRYGRLTCAQKLTRWELNITHGTETKKLGKKWKQKPSSSEETVQAIVRESSPGGRSETTGVIGFLKQVVLSRE